MHRNHPAALRHALACALAAFALPSTGLAATRLVPSEYPTITAALAAAGANDEILVAPGTYSASSNGEIYPLALTISGVQLVAAGPGTILDAEQGSGVLRVDVPGDARVSGFTITNGIAVRGGGVFVLNGTPEIDHNVIVGNGAANRGAGVFALGTAAPWIHHNVVWENFDSDTSDALDPHGIVLQDDATGVVEHNLVGRTDGNGLLTSTNAQPVVRHNIFLENGQPDPIRGRGICWLADSPAIVMHNLFHANTVAAILWTAGGGNLSGTAANNVDSGDQVYGNVDGDPLLADVDGGDFHLTPGSPAIDAGDPALPLDPDGTVADLGPFYLDQNALAAPARAPAVALSAYPNPFRGRTTIALGRGRRGVAQVDIVDISGRRVRTIRAEPAALDVSWDGRDESGTPVAAGVYLARITDPEGPTVSTVPLVRIR